MTRNRIFFPGNPWPEGHAVDEFHWKASVRDGQVWFDLHLQTAAYDADREIEEADEEEDEEDDDEDFASDWEAPGVWTNYHRCTISSTKWPGYRGFAVGPVAGYSLESLDGFEATVDDPPPADQSANALHTYLFSHGAVARHRIRFERIAGTARFDITWTGRIALSFGGDPDYDREFTATLFGIEAPAPA
ncbi:hypothetical protein ACSFBX_00440 [Variovorax sp. RB2P76]|uniref:hypothetical protein n=1 Tax=Variovorax sp. RB2P76 TaxID=3443736 RepID=UPI003F445EB3